MEKFQFGMDEDENVKARFSYETLNDAGTRYRYEGLKRGCSRIFYAKDPSFRVSKEKPNLKKDYVYLGSIKETDLEKIFHLMQAEIWSPYGEARELIIGKGLHHTSISVGDVVVINGMMYQVDMIGFKEF